MSRLTQRCASFALGFGLAFAPWADAAIQYLMGPPGQVVMFGLSSDTKPTTGNASVNGAVFIEVDTAKHFRREAGVWVEKPDAGYQLLATDLTRLVDNCVVENDSTPIPDSCVGDGSDAGAGGGAPTTVDYLVGTADGTLSNEIVVGTTPGGELGNTWASPTLDDSVTVTGWVMGASTATAPAANDNDTSLATSDFVQGEIDDGDNLTDNCALEADATPVPDSCVGNGADDGAATNIDYLVGTATGGLSAEIAVGTTPGGELGNTWASPTLDDTVTVDAWTMGASFATSPAANDNDTSLATSAFVQSEIDDGDNITDNCALENDATPIPDSCVGDGSDAGGSYTFNLDGDNNSPQAIDSGNEALIAGGTNGVDTVASATDTVTINLDLSESAAGGELGGNLDAPTIDDTITVTGWTMGASVATSPAADDNDTSLATSAFVQSEIDDGDNLTNNCALEADATPIPDSCVGNGTDDTGGGGGSWTLLGQTGDANKTDNTLAASAFMTVALSASTNYTVRGVAYLLVQNASADARYSLNYSGTWTTIYCIDSRNVAGVAAGTDATTVRPASAIIPSTDVLATATGIVIVEFECTGLTNGAGTLDFRFAQVTTNGTATILKRGSYMEYASF